MAPSAAAIEIRDIFSEIMTNNLRYCALCFRTEKERRLVEPTYLMKCLCVMRMEPPAVTTICFVCEASAARAVSLFQAISLSVVINCWFKEAATKLKYRASMPEHLDWYAEKNLRGASLPGLAAAPLAAGWRRARARDNLAPTDVLVVSDQPAKVETNAEEDAMSEPRASPSPLSPSPLPPSPLSPLAQLERIQNPVIDNVVIIEDDDEPPDVASAPPVACAPVQLVSLEQLLANRGAAALVPDEMQVLVRDKDAFVLHPVVCRADGALLVPSLNARLRDGRLLPSAGTDSGGEEILSTLSVSVNGSQFPAPSATVPPSPVALSPVALSPAGTAGLAARAALPVSGSRIDWEDKIPMDVISFMDATDPMAHEIMNPTPPRARKRGRRGDCDVIDLC